eukprot:m.129498 g.129498  ORF g.129498 m.129498 type:complete len:59 (+) comp23645_c0_seq1:162-338(+)
MRSPDLLISTLMDLVGQTTSCDLGPILVCLLVELFSFHVRYCRYGRLLLCAYGVVIAF